MSWNHCGNVLLLQGALAGERSRNQSGKGALEKANAEMIDLRKALKASMTKEEETHKQYVARGQEIQRLADKLQFFGSSKESDLAACKNENAALKAEIERLQAALREAKAALWEADARRRSIVETQVVDAPKAWLVWVPVMGREARPHSRYPKDLHLHLFHSRHPKDLRLHLCPYRCQVHVMM